jgi:hypothetical protein
MLTLGELEAMFQKWVTKKKENQLMRIAADCYFITRYIFIVSLSPYQGPIGITYSG